MEKKLQQLKQEIVSELEKITDKQSLARLELKYFSRKGRLSAALREIAALSEAERVVIGKIANEIKNELNVKLAEIRKLVAEKRRKEFIDPTLPGKKIERGHLHPITLIQNELEDLFLSMGFMVLDGPELESDYYNFEALNIPKYHPARDMQDTFYVEIPNPKSPPDFACERTRWRAGQIQNSKFKNLEKSDLVMRTHTSPVQVRAMQKYGAPLRCVAPGRVFRCEATDSAHEHTFYQMEGLMVDKNISIANLIAVMKELLKGIFKKEMEVRVRPGYFPFVEPGIELDIKCTICGGAKCPSCKNSGWLELMPAGIVHPNVLKYGRIDPKKYSGFAFGLGLTRLAMMKYGVDDIRLFNSGDLRFLKQF